MEQSAQATAESADSGEVQEAQVAFASRRGGMRSKRTAKPKTETSSEEERTQEKNCVFFRRKVPKKSALCAASTAKQDESSSSAGVGKDLLHRYESNRALNLHDDQGATATTGVDAGRGQDHRALLERNEEVGKAILEGKLERGVYRGMGAYAPASSKREGSIAAGKYTGLYGPVRGMDNVRMTMRIDYDPCICKDYKETGYCGFGDSCKFLHDRTDYKGGWQLDKEWEAAQKKKQDKLRNPTEPNSDDEDSSSEEDDSGEKLPFACLNCREKWHKKSNPVVTQCGHYFCESCAVSHHTTSNKCHECSEPTYGIFNTATKILSKLSDEDEEAEAENDEADDTDEPQ
eukprot:GHVQ01033233.1.p1 GENE.GHVQ01033233.1~~GHVQ01033233.1.p1  ORF type:complete len:346 (+),score=57.61 GHVQ01033233.1:293-1330(+)